MNDIIYLKDHKDMEDILKSYDKIVIFFHTSDCVKCNMISFDKLSDNIKDIQVVDILCDIPEHIDIAGKYEVITVPALIFIKDGNAVGGSQGEVLLGEEILELAKSLFN